MDVATKARNAVENLSGVLAQTPHAKAMTIVPHLRLIENLCTEHNSPPIAVHMEMLRIRAIPIVIKALGRVCSLNLGVADKDDVTKCIGSGFGMLTRSLRGRQWVCQALDSGFVSVFLSSGRWIARLGYDSWASICSKLFTILCQNLVFRSVVRSIGHAISRKKIDALDASAEAAGLNPQWVPFKTEAYRFLVYKTQFDDDKDNSKEPGFAGCANPDCPKKTDMHEFMRCSACLNILFCSKKCQQKEWQNHRNECKKQQKVLREGLQAPLSQSDSNFLHHVAWQDYLYFLEKINNQIYEEYPSIPSYSLFVDLDYYSVFPSTANVRLASDFPFGLHPGERSNVDAVFRKAKEQPTPAIVLRMAFRDGYAIHQITQVMQAPDIAAAWLKDQE